MTPEVAILVPHFQTLELTTLCLRMLRANTFPKDYETIVIDNGSMDGSGEELRRVRWARILRRNPKPQESLAESHGRALDFALAHTNAPFIAVIHTDSMAIRPDWLIFLMEQLIAGGTRTVSVGAWKGEPPIWQRPGKWLERTLQLLAGRMEPARCFPRSSCALYRRDALLLRPDPFTPTRGFSPGEELHTLHLTLGFSSILLDPILLSRYVQHLNHATLALNRHLGAGDRNVARTRRKALRRLERFCAEARAQRILADVALDT